MKTDCKLTVKDLIEMLSNLNNDMEIVLEGNEYETEKIEGIRVVDGQAIIF